MSMVLATVACSDRSPSGPDASALNPPAGMVVSNSLTSSGSSSIGVRGAERSSLEISASTVAYISAVPGTFPGALSAAVRNKTRGGASRSVQVINGGFDPVGIEAATGDELSITVSLEGGGSTSMEVKVPPRRPPEVVRTNPPKGRTDVALNVQVVVVFSEPVNKSSVTSSSVALLLDGTAVKASVRVSDDGLSAELIPDSPLQPGTTYALVVNQGIRDLDGDALSDASTVAFTTGAATTGTLVVTTATTAAATSDLDPNGYFVVIDNEPSRAIGVNGAVTIADVAGGVHAVTLKGVIGNCALAGSAIRSIQVTVGSATTVAFDITCAPISANADMLAFVSERDGNPEIYVVNFDGTGLARLTNHPTNDRDPAWSPDGRRIAFVSDRFDGPNIYIMDADGSNVVRCTDTGGADPAWSPDGRKIAFTNLKDGSDNIYTINPDERGASPIPVIAAPGYDAQPAWSPDGSRIAFVSDYRAYDFVFDVWVANPDGSDMKPLIMGPFSAAAIDYSQPAWSPDGSKIAVVANGLSIVVGNADGSGLKTVARAGGNASPTWSRDGSMIAFEAENSVRYVAADGTGSGLIVSNGHSPSWRP